MKRVLLKISQNYQEKYLCLILFFNKLAGLRLGTLLKERFKNVGFPVNL